MIRFGQALAGARRNRVTVAPAAARAAMSLRGDPDFNAASLSAEQQSRLTSLKSLISTSPGGTRDPYTMAGRDCIWWYGHDLRTHVMAQMIAFRITGDLWFLDVLDELAEIMKTKLADAWRGTDDGTDGTTDGYLNWAHTTTTGTTYINGVARSNKGKDIRLEYDQQAHETIAWIAYALDLNRDLTSPKGYAYGTHADYWKGYLVDHFEAKIRSRTFASTWGYGNATGYPVTDWPITNHAYGSWMHWHYYMGKLLSDSGYLAEAERMTDVLFGQFCLDEGAYSFIRTNHDLPHAAFGEYATPTSYSDFTYLYAVDLYHEGFHTWAASVHLERFAATLKRIMMTLPTTIATSTEVLLRDVAGEVTRCGVAPASSGSFSRVSPFQYQNASWALISPWEQGTPAIPDFTERLRAFAESQGWDYVRLVAAQFLHAHLHGEPA